MNIKRPRCRHWNEEAKTEKQEQLAPFHLLLDAKLQEQADFKGLPTSALRC
jgi:hypothetical protein